MLAAFFWPVAAAGGYVVFGAQKEGRQATLSDSPAVETRADARCLGGSFRSGLFPLLRGELLVNSGIGADGLPTKRTPRTTW